MRGFEHGGGKVVVNALRLGAFAAAEIESSNGASIQEVVSGAAGECGGQYFVRPETARCWNEADSV